MNSDDIQAVIEAQRAARHRREVKRMAAASPTIKSAREVEGILNGISGLSS